jgi:hypothetical protein
MPNTNPFVLTQFAAPDPNAAPITLAQLVATLNLLVSSEIQGSYIPYVKQNGTPGVDDQDKAWLELDSQGRPIGIKTFWNGHWRRVYNGMPGEIRGYSGDPTVDFDSQGLGKVGLAYDGWHICNGLDGTPDMSDRFPIGAHMNNVDHPGFSAGQWQTWVSNTTAEHTGGVRDFTLDENTSFWREVPAVRARLWTATGNAPQPHTGDLWGLKSNTTDTDNDDIAGKVPGPPKATPNPVSVINPFIAQAWIIFVGYS